ncbi:PA0069 family radical SAM protein [Schlesneria paludicola]|uniref:PA0069 family radical SAM protein n=1 Tax=Schlesneria paludicola TaxID=360056 RepID=UPI00058AF988|nr:PA0069 family radical SAM protein [Schlesneria paludicola]
MTDPIRPGEVGRGAQSNPTNRFARIEVVVDEDSFDESSEENPPRTKTQYFSDLSKSVVTENDSPDVFFRYSINPYRGCSHGCSYCYARPTHEYLDLSAGLDFETKIFVKERAPELFRDWLARDRYRPEIVMMSGVTDCYQPAERHFQLTRKCLEVALAARQPIAIVTKNALVTRDIDLLRQMAERNLVSVAISITTLDQALTRSMEPRTSSPRARLRALRELTDAGVPTHVMIAPVIPSLNDSQIPSVLKAASEAGATSAGYVLLRLPHTVKPVFLDWLAVALPNQRERIESRLRDTRGGKLYEADFSTRMTGRGQIADQIRQTFEVFANKYGLNQKHEELDTSQFVRPIPKSGQMWLFND